MLRTRLKRTSQTPAADAGAELEVDPAEERTLALARALEEVQGSTAAPLRVMQLVDNANSTAQHVAEAIDTDPIFTAQLLRLANSASFGLSNTISTTVRAVSVVGFTTVRSLSALLATGLDGHRQPAPAGFWEHSAATAAGCVAVATRFGMQPGEAFAMGLLHDLGWAILNEVDPLAHQAAISGLLGTSDQCRAEAELFGLSHAEAAARVLDSWNFPPAVVAAILCHHDPSRIDTVHSQVILAGDALAHLVLAPLGFGACPSEFDDMGFTPDAVKALAELTEDYTKEILASLPT